MFYNSKHRISIIFLIAILIFSCSEKPETLTEDFDEKKMEGAILEARSRFDEFLSRYKNPQPGDDNFNVKVKIEGKNGTEHFWVGGLELDTEPYSGVIANEPGIVKNVRFGQRYSFSSEDVSDWMYMSNGKMEGNYTLRVALEAMPPNEAEALKKEIGW